MIEERIGGGAFASVWRAHDEALESTVAIKVLSENWVDSTDVRRRFLAEARLLRRAESDRVVRVHDLGELDDGRPYLVMTHADRGTLADRLKPGPLPWREGVSIAVEIGRALRSLHTAGVLHRDIKPSNVLFRSQPDGRDLVLLGDLGLGKLLAEASMLTLAGGTPAYMAPEQARPGTPLSVRTDIYGLGALLYRTLTGRHPHGATDFATIADPDRTAPAAPSTLVPDLPGRLDAAVLRALSAEPGRRQADAAELVTQLREVLGEPRSDASSSTLPATPREGVTVPVRHPPRPLPSPPTVPSMPAEFSFVPIPTRRRRRWWLPVTGLVVAAALVAGGWLYLNRDRPTEEQITDSSRTVRLRVPVAWAKEVADQGWDPQLLGVRGERQPGVAVAESVSDLPRADDNRPGAFAGVLPPGVSVATHDFTGWVSRPGCSPNTNQGEGDPAGLLVGVRQRCGSAVVDDYLLDRSGRQVWVQVKQPADDPGAVRRLLDSVEVGPSG